MPRDTASCSIEIIVMSLTPSGEQDVTERIENIPTAVNKKWLATTTAADKFGQ
jgi:hypothetical protein